MCRPRPVGPAVGHFLLDEPVRGGFLVGGVLVVLGVYWGALRRPRDTSGRLASVHA